MDNRAPAAWWFVAPTSEPAVDPKGSEPRRLLDALRAGVGLRAAFRLEWTTGRAATVGLATADPLSTRWVERLLIPAYAPGRWRRVGSRRRDARPPRDVRFGALRGEPGASLPHPDPGPWTDVVLASLPALSPGLSVVWEFRGLGLGPWKSPRGRFAEPEPIPIGARPRPLTMPERLERDRREVRRRSPIWELRLAVASNGSASAHVARANLERLLEAASTRDGDARLRFVRGHRWLRPRPPALYLAEPEVAGVLPGRASRFVTSLELGPVPAAALSLGTDSAGDPVGIPVEPLDGRHLAVVGETGMGKSTLLVRLALAATAVGTVVLFDPIGDTGRRFIERLPPSLRSRVVWILPADSPVTLDLLEPLRPGAGADVDADRALSALVDALRRVRAARYSDSPFWGPRIEETLRTTLAAAAAITGATIADAESILAGSLGRNPPVLPPARAAFDALRERVRERPEEVDGSRRLLREITQRPALLRMLTGGSGAFRFRDLSSPGRIYVLTGDAPTLGEAAARYLLSIYLALFWSERLSIPRPPKTFLVLDEAQWYAHESVSEMLRLGRRSNLHVWLATQALTSLPEGVREAVGTNVADSIVFRGSPEGAREIARLTPAVTAETLWGLPRGTAAALLGKGERVTFVVVPPLGARHPRADDALHAVAVASRRYWGEPEAGESDSPPGSPAGTPASEPTTPAVADLRELLLVLWAGLLDAPGAESIRVYLGDLRRTVDPSGALVRSAGRVLDDGAVLQRSDRDARGTYWEVARDGFSRLLGPGVEPGELERAARRWRDVVDGGSGPAQYS